MKRVIALLLSFAMLIPTAFSTSVSAYEEEPVTVVEETEETPETTEETEEETTEEPEASEPEAQASEPEGEQNEEPQTVISEEKKANAPLQKTESLRGTAVAVDFSNLEKAYSKANAYLISLDKKVALYSIASMQTLIDLLGDSKISEYLGADDPSIFDSSDEEAANLLADDINSAYASLQKVSGSADLSSYLAAADAINNLDMDAYTETRSIGSATRISNILVKTTALSYTDALDSEKTSSISCFKGTASQQNIDDATRTILDALYVSVKVYTVTTSGAVVDASFQNGTSTGDESPYTATYGSTVVAYSDIDDTAWYLDYSSDSIIRSRQFQGYGSSFRAKIFGNVNVYAETRTSEAPNMVRVHRTYSNIEGVSAIQAMTFVENSYTLPSAKVIPNYSFSGYIINNDRENPLSEGTAIPVTGDTEIEAYYVYNSSADYTVEATPLASGTGFNDSAEYNQRIELEGGDNAYAWVEEVGVGKYRPFVIGSDISFLVTESITLFAVTEEQFDDYGFSLPAVNMRKDGGIVSGTKVIFNGQIVDVNDRVREYGVVIGVAKNGAELDMDNIIVENAGSHEDYDVIRAKSTRSVGANQFAISINGLAGKEFVYRGYLIYEKTNGEYISVYSD